MLSWKEIVRQLTLRDRHARVNRVTKETQIDVNVWLDREGGSKIKTGVGFFDHMLIRSPPTAASAWRSTSKATCISTITTP